MNPLSISVSRMADVMIRQMMRDVAVTCVLLAAFLLELRLRFATGPTALDLGVLLSIAITWLLVLFTGFRLRRLGLRWPRWASEAAQTSAPRRRSEASLAADNGHHRH